MVIDDLRQAFLTNGLSDDQLNELIAVGEEIHAAPGEELFREAEPADHLWIFLEGRLEMSRLSGGERIVVAVMTTPGQWAGGLRAWEGEDHSSGYRATGRATTPTRMFRVPSPELSRLVGQWFPFAKHLILGVYQTVRGIEDAARQRESLVALGTLAAGLAHEINNPAAASLRAVEALGDTCDQMVQSLGNLAQQTITAAEFVALDQFRRELAEHPSNDAGAVDRMDREDAVGTWLERHGVDRPWQIASQLATAGADEAWLQQIEDLLGRGPLAPALHWTTSTINASTLLQELRDSTNRISNLIEGVKSYSQMDRAAQQQINVHDGIESTLTMLATKLNGVEVVRQFGNDIPEIVAYPGELNQVWTNLIDNAIDAVGGAGTVTLATRREGDDVIIEITDSGHGMDEAVRARVFEPFFTTKDVGKGTGLGLDISRRIVVSRHHGEISFESVPGATTARVRLPITP